MIAGTIFNATTHDRKAFPNHGGFHDCFNAKLRPVKAKRLPQVIKTPKQIVVIRAGCNGNGAVLCSQCKGNGVNSVNFFDGQLKAGDCCWLRGGQKEMLCRNCNAAGFIGGFVSTDDE